MELFCPLPSLRAPRKSYFTNLCDTRSIRIHAPKVINTHAHTQYCGCNKREYTGKSCDSHKLQHVIWVLTSEMKILLILSILKFGKNNAAIIGCLILLGTKIAECNEI